MIDLKEAVDRWIQKAVKRPGSLRKALKVPKDKKISAKKLASAGKKARKTGNKLLAKRVQLAKTLKKLSKDR